MGRPELQFTVSREASVPRACLKGTSVYNPAEDAPLAEEYVSVFQLNAAVVRAETKGITPKIAALAFVRPPLSREDDDKLIDLTSELLARAIDEKLAA